MESQNSTFLDCFIVFFVFFFILSDTIKVLKTSIFLMASKRKLDYIQYKRMRKMTLL